MSFFYLRSNPEKSDRITGHHVISGLFQIFLEWWVQFSERCYTSFFFFRFFFTFYISFSMVIFKQSWSVVNWINDTYKNHWKRLQTTYGKKSQNWRCFNSDLRDKQAACKIIPNNVDVPELGEKYWNHPDNSQSLVGWLVGCSYRLGMKKRNNTCSNALNCVMSCHGIFLKSKQRFVVWETDLWRFIYLFTGKLAQRLECSPVARETWVQSQVESYQRL